MFDDYESFDTACLCSVFLFSSITKVEAPSLSLPFSITFLSPPEGNWISLSPCATCIFPVYPQLILGINSELCFLELCYVLHYGMVCVGIIIIERLAKWGKINKKIKMFS